MPYLLERQPDIPVSEATLETAAMNPCGGRAENPMQLLLAKKPDLNISEHLIKSMLSGSNTASAFYVLIKGQPATIVTEDLFDLAAKNETNALLLMFILLEHNPDLLPNKAVLLSAVQNKSLGGQWWDILYDRWTNHRLAEDFLQAVIDKTRNGILMMIFFPINQYTTKAKIQAAAKSALEWEGNLVKEKKENPNWEVDMAYPRNISPDPLQCDNDS